MQFRNAMEAALNVSSSQGILLLKNSRCDQQEATEEYLMALKHFPDFILHAVIVESVK